MWITKFFKPTKLFNINLFSSTKQIEGIKKYSEIISKSRPVMHLYNLTPVYSGRNFIAPNATIVGQVFLGNNITIWHGTVIRGDINAVRLHHNITIGDNCVLHTASSLPSGLPAILEFYGQNIVQSGCTLYSCVLKRNAFVGYNSVILEGAIIEEGAIIAPNSVVPPGRAVPARQVWGGNPIKFIRHSSQKESFVTKNLAYETVAKANTYAYQFLPFNNAYLYKQNNPQDMIIQKYDYSSQGRKHLQQNSYNQDYSTI